MKINKSNNTYTETVNKQPEEENNSEETTKLSYLDFEKSTSLSTTDNLAFSLKEQINYGRFHVLFKYGDFPVFIFPTDKLIPICFISFIVFSRIFLNPWLDLVFENKWVKLLAYWDINFFVIIFILWITLNPGIAGFNIGSKFRQRKDKG